MYKFCFGYGNIGNNPVIAFNMQRHRLAVSCLYDSPHPVPDILIPYPDFPSGKGFKLSSIFYIALCSGRTYFHRNVIFRKSRHFILKQDKQKRLQCMMGL